MFTLTLWFYNGGELEHYETFETADDAKMAAWTLMEAPFHGISGFCVSIL